MKRKFILISGKGRSGKATAAKFFNSKLENSIILHLADDLKTFAYDDMKKVITAFNNVLIDIKSILLNSNIQSCIPLNDSITLDKLLTDNITKRKHFKHGDN